MPDADGILRHIRHAEEWLRWARADCRRGDIRSAVLRLLLAEAEIRHAREAGASLVVRPASPRGSRRLSAAALGAAAALVIAAAGYAVLRPGPLPGPAAADSAAAPVAGGTPGVVQLDTGHLLTIMPALSDPEQEQERSAGQPASWGSGFLRGRLFDGPAGRPGHGPAQIGEPASLTTPADPAHLSPTF